jgi:glutathione S-transferase
MTLVYVVMMIALIEYFAFGLAVGRARGRYGVQAPATSGHPDFERYYRIQMNTLEQLMVFVPSLWVFGTYVSAGWAAALGAMFVVGRLLYFIGYSKAANKRFAGFGISALAVMALMIGGLVGAVMALLRSP